MSVAEIEMRQNVIASGMHPDVFLKISEPCLTLKIWRRRLASELESIAELISKHALDLCTVINPCCKQDRHIFMQELNNVVGQDCTALADDLLYLSKHFAAASNKQRVRIRLEIIEDDGCRRFHIDNVVMRLVTTYHGQGTQWVSPGFAVAARDRQMSYKGPLNSLGTGDAAIFLGKKSGANGLILHRSPPQTPNDPARLVAVIDGADI